MELRGKLRFSKPSEEVFSFFVWSLTALTAKKSFEASGGNKPCNEGGTKSQSGL